MGCGYRALVTPSIGYGVWMGDSGVVGSSYRIWGEVGDSGVVGSSYRIWGVDIGLS